MSSTLRRFRPSPRAFFGVVGLIAAAGGAILLTVWAAASNLYLSPGTGSFQKDSTISLALRVNSDSSVSSVQANLSYPTDKLEFISIDASGSAFELSTESSGSAGSVKIARTTVVPKTGNQLVATINFKAIAGSGSAAVNFASGSAIATGLGGVGTTTTTNGSYTLTTPTAGGGGTGGGTGGGGGVTTPVTTTTPTTTPTTTAPTGGSPMLQTPSSSKPKSTTPTTTTPPSTSTTAPTEVATSEQAPAAETTTETDQSTPTPPTDTTAKANKLAFSTPQKRAIALTIMGSGLSSATAAGFMVLRRRNVFNLGSLTKAKAATQTMHEVPQSSAVPAIAMASMMGRTAPLAAHQPPAANVASHPVEPVPPPQIVAQEHNLIPEAPPPPPPEPVLSQPLPELTPQPQPMVTNPEPAPAATEQPAPAVAAFPAAPIVATRARAAVAPVARNPVFLQPTYRVHSPTSIRSGPANNFTRTH